MPLYFIRHGESLNNAKKLFTGRSDSPLTKKGEHQARQTAEEIRSLGEIYQIISSPLSRAIRTAEIIAESLGHDNLIKVDGRIIEYDLGELTGDKWRRIPEEEFAKLQDVEDPTEFRSRLVDFLNEYKNHDGNILIVAHAGVYRMIESARLGLEPAAFHTIDRPKNASYIKLELSWLDNL